MIWASGVSKLKRNLWAGILALGVVVLIHVTDRCVVVTSRSFLFLN